MEYEVADNLLLVPLLDIFVDPEFNCRGRFSATSVQDLAKSIRDKGLIEPLIIQPIEDVPEDEVPEPCPWKFRLVAGHRRYMAIDQFTNMDTAKCSIVKGLSKEEAHDLNFTENLKRQDLNMLQEAIAIRRAYPNLSANKIAVEKLNCNVRWVRVRLKLLDMPEKIQTSAASGLLSQHDVETLASIEPYEVMSAYQKLIASKGRMSQPPLIGGKNSWRRLRSRSKNDIGKMIAFLYEHQVFTKLTDRELKLVNSALAWASRGIDSEEFLVGRLDIPRDQVKIEKDSKFEIVFN